MSETIGPILFILTILGFVICLCSMGTWHILESGAITSHIQKSVAAGAEYSNCYHQFGEKP